MVQQSVDVVGVYLGKRATLYALVKSAHIVGFIVGRIAKNKPFLSPAVKR